MTEHVQPNNLIVAEEITSSDTTQADCKAMRDAGKSMAGADSIVVAIYRKYQDNTGMLELVCAEFRVGYYMKRFGVTEKAARAIESRAKRPTDETKANDTHKSPDEMAAYGAARVALSRIAAHVRGPKKAAARPTKAEPTIIARITIEDAKSPEQLLAMLGEVKRALKATYDQNAKHAKGDAFGPWRDLFASQVWHATSFK